MPDKMHSLHRLMSSFSQDITRDLAWSVFAPPLLTHNEIPFFRPALTDLRIKWLQEVDRQQQTLKPDYRLGRYHESLWAYFFQHDEQYKWIAQNIAITKHGKTLGEIDFIVLDHETERFIHLEVAVKFYLFHPPTQTTSNILTKNDNRNWLGPNSTDNLERKWQHLTQQQCRISQKQDTFQTLEKFGIDCSKLDQALCLKGYVFSPFNKNISPLFFNQENNLYHYFTMAEFEHKNRCGAIVSIIPKQRWLTQIHEKKALTPLSHDALLNTIKEISVPIMIAELHEANNQFIETNRFFVTPPSWP
jgi:uncharacterized protein